MMKCRKVVICGNGDERLCEQSLKHYESTFEVVAYASIKKLVDGDTVAGLPVIKLSQIENYPEALVVVALQVNAFDVFLRLTRDYGVLAENIETERFNGEIDGFNSRESRQMRRQPSFSIKRAKRSLQCFLVTSSGRSGSRWFASSMHRHPEIACGNGVDHPWDSFRHRYNPKELKGILKLVLKDPAVFSAGLHLKEYLKKELDREGIEANIPTRDFRDLFETVLREFDCLNQSRVFGDVKVMGNVHGLMNNELSSALNKYSDLYREYSPVFAQLVRHPITRFESRVSAHAAHLERGYFGEDELKRINAYCDENLDEIRSIERKHKFDFELKDRLFFWFSRRMEVQKHWAIELTAYDIEHLPFERLKSDPGYFSWAVGYLTRNQVSMDESLLADIFSPENLKGGRGSADLDQTKLPSPPLQQFNEWSDWQREEFIAIAEKYDLQNVYAKVGYDFSFVR